MKNIYIENHEEIKHITKTVKTNGKEQQAPADLGVQLDIFEKNHGLEYNAFARAQYTAIFAPRRLSADQKRLLQEA